MLTFTKKPLTKRLSDAAAAAADYAAEAGDRADFEMQSAFLSIAGKLSEASMGARPDDGETGIRRAVLHTSARPGASSGA